LSFSLLKGSQFLSRDNTPSVVLAEWELKADYFEEDFLYGISPVLFATDPKASEEGIRANTETVKKDLDRLNRIFFVPESIELNDALKIVKKARLGDVDYVFKRKNLDRLFKPVCFPTGKSTLITCLEPYCKFKLSAFVYLQNSSQITNLKKKAKIFFVVNSVTF
jgi:hypothetical protein